MFKIYKKNKNKNIDDHKTTLFYKKRGWKIFFVIFVVIAIVVGSYIAYLYASGKRVFDPKSLTISPFFKSLAGESYELRGEGDGRINVLFLGMGGANHPGGTLTDTIMILSIDPVNKNMAMMSIPRDIYYPVKGSSTNKINELYSIGEKKETGNGAKYVKGEISKILDLPIHYYVTLDFYAFTELINEIGGIDVYVEKNLYDPYYPDQNMKGYDPFYIKAGQQHLDGKTALKYSRSRQTTSDFDRAARQQKVIQAVREKVLKLGYLSNPKNILDIVNLVGDHVRTDFSPKEIYALAELLKEIDISTIISKVLTNQNKGELYSCNGSYLCPVGDNWEQVQRIAHEIFTDPNLVDENARIEVLNGTSTVGMATKLADTLKSYNYNVVSVDNADKSYQKTIIIDYSKGSKKITRQFLQKRLNADIVEKSSGGNNADLTIIIGEDYKGFSVSE